MTTLPFRTDREVRDALTAAIRHLDTGGLLAHPTETVYGVGGRPVADDIAAVTALKDRDDPKPQLLLVEGTSMIEALGLQLERAATALAEAFWPGPLTLVLPGGPGLPRSLRGPSGGIAVRWTSHPGMRTLLAARGAPITSTSANLTGHPTATTGAEVEELFPRAIAAGRLLVLDGGELAGAPASTVVDCTGDEACIVREGAVPRADLVPVIGSTAS